MLARAWQSAASATLFFLSRTHKHKHKHTHTICIYNNAYTQNSRPHAHVIIICMHPVYAAMHDVMWYWYSKLVYDGCMVKCVLRWQFHVASAM